MSALLGVIEKMEKTDMAIDPNVAEWLYAFIKTNSNIQHTLDVGLGEAASAMTVMMATGKPHTAIDPLCFTEAGVRNVETFGFGQQLELIKTTSFFALPELLKNGRKFDYTFIDAGGKIDDLFCDFFYISMMTNLNGFVLIPDNDRPTVLKFIEFIRANRKDFEIIVPEERVRITILRKIKDKDERSWNYFESF